MITIEELADIDTARVLQAGPGRFTSAVADSRDVAPGQLFFALAGARDGHEFVDAAVSAGAAGVVVSRDVDVPDQEVAVIRVADPQRALQDLAAAHQSKAGVDTIAVTGSVGKTTTKDLLAKVLARAGAVYSSPKSYNNHLGVPLTLLGAPEATELLVSEIGTNNPGEIAALADLVRPRIGVVMNVGFAHVGGFGTREALATEKASLLASVPEGGVWVTNADEEHLDAAVQALPRAPQTRWVRFGFAEDAEVRVSDVEVSATQTSGTVHLADRSCRFVFPLVGRHFAHTVAAAVAVGLECGLSLDDVVESLADFSASAGRASIQLDEVRGLRLIDDSYNGSPDSTLAALDTLAVCPEPRRVAVLGEMRELGDWSDRLHEAVGTRAAQCATDLVFAGPSFEIVAQAAQAAGMSAERIVRADSAAAAINPVRRLVESAPDGVAVLVKGSRFMHTERVTLALAGVEVGCAKTVCEFYIHCRDCPELPGTPGQAPRE